MTPGHYIDRCVCGVIVRRCRCPGPHEERTVRPCTHKPTSAVSVQHEDDAAKANAGLAANGFA